MSLFSLLIRKKIIIIIIRVLHDRCEQYEINLPSPPQCLKRQERKEKKKAENLEERSCRRKKKKNDKDVDRPKGKKEKQ